MEMFATISDDDEIDRRGNELRSAARQPRPVPWQRGFGYLRFSISGSVTDPTAAVSALADPQMPEKNMVERIATIPIAPRIFPMKSIASVDDPGGDAAAPHDRARRE